MNKLDYCFHTHTSRCGHAVGEDYEYPLAAQKAGFKIMGWSDHAMLPNLVQPRMRGNFEAFPGYVKSVRDLQAKYEGTLQILLGMECEWYGNLYSDYYHKILNDGTLDYAILGQHNFIQNGTPIFYGNVADKHLALHSYVNDLIAGMESGLFLYVAHPDLFMIWYHTFDDDALKASRLIIDKAKELNMPLEVNMGPSRWACEGDLAGEKLVPYPDPRFWDLVAKAKVNVVIGVDAHSPDDFYTSDFAWVLGFIKRHKLHLLNGQEILGRIKKK
jgi:histidinol-phosphatase (PHP family)